MKREQTERPEQSGSVDNHLIPASVTARRYRTSKYFLQDQLKCSEAIHDFQSVKHLVNRLQSFSLRDKFEFAPEYLPLGRQ